MGFPREILRKTPAILTEDGKSNILFNLTWPNGLELMLQLSLGTENLRRPALSLTDFPRRPELSLTDNHSAHGRL